MLARYFAYGSNMNPKRVAQRGLRVRNARSAALINYQLVFDKLGREKPGAGHANVVRAPGARVEGVLYELSTPAEILKMDVFERSPVNYGRDAVALQVDQETVWAWTYFANTAQRRTNLRPTAEYLAHLLAGVDYLSAPYHQKLQAIACLNTC